MFDRMEMPKEPESVGVEMMLKCEKFLHSAISGLSIVRLYLREISKAKF